MQPELKTNKVVLKFGTRWYYEDDYITVQHGNDKYTGMIRHVFYCDNVPTLLILHQVVNMTTDVTIPVQTFNLTQCQLIIDYDYLD